MQIKKEQVKDNLLRVGLEQFTMKGYEKASLRVIVKEAGTTLGNFYNYFPNKEALFEAIVDESYIGFNQFLHHHKDEEGHDQPVELTPEVLMAARYLLMDQIRGLLPALTPSFLLLIDRSQGTKYEGFRREVVAFFTDHYMEHLASKGMDDLYGYSLVAGEMFVSGLIQIIRRNDELDHVVASLTNHFMFFIFGTTGIITMEEKR